MLSLTAEKVIPRPLFTVNNNFICPLIGPSQFLEDED